MRAAHAAGRPYAGGAAPWRRRCAAAPLRTRRIGLRPLCASADAGEPDLSEPLEFTGSLDCRPRIRTLSGTENIEESLQHDIQSSFEDFVMVNEERSLFYLLGRTAEELEALSSLYFQRDAAQGDGSSSKEANVPGPGLLPAVDQRGDPTSPGTNYGSLHPEVKRSLNVQDIFLRLFQKIDDKSVASPTWPLLETWPTPDADGVDSALRLLSLTRWLLYPELPYATADSQLALSFMPRAAFATLSRPPADVALPAMNWERLIGHQPYVAVAWEGTFTNINIGPLAFDAGFLGRCERRVAALLANLCNEPVPDGLLHEGDPPVNIAVGKRRVGLEGCARLMLDGAMASKYDAASRRGGLEGQAWCACVASHRRCAALTRAAVRRVDACTSVMLAIRSVGRVIWARQGPDDYDYHSKTEKPPTRLILLLPPELAQDKELFEAYARSYVRPHSEGLSILSAVMSDLAVVASETSSELDADSQHRFLLERSNTHVLYTAIAAATRQALFRLVKSGRRDAARRLAWHCIRKDMDEDARTKPYAEQRSQFLRKRCGRGIPALLQTRVLDICVSRSEEPAVKPSNALIPKRKPLIVSFASLSDSDDAILSCADHALHMASELDAKLLCLGFGASTDSVASATRLQSILSQSISSAKDLEEFLEKANALRSAHLDKLSSNKFPSLSSPIDMVLQVVTETLQGSTQAVLDASPRLRKILSDGTKVTISVPSEYIKETLAALALSTASSAAESQDAVGGVAEGSDLARSMREPAELPTQLKWLDLSDSEAVTEIVGTRQRQLFEFDRSETNRMVKALATTIREEIEAISSVMRLDDEALLQQFPGYPRDPNAALRVSEVLWWFAKWRTDSALAWSLKDGVAPNVDAIRARALAVLNRVMNDTELNKASDVFKPQTIQSSRQTLVTMILSHFSDEVRDLREAAARHKQEAARAKAKAKADAERALKEQKKQAEKLAREQAEAAARAREVAKQAAERAAIERRAEEARLAQEAAAAAAAAALAKAEAAVREAAAEASEAAAATWPLERQREAATRWREALVTAGDADSPDADALRSALASFDAACTGAARLKAAVEAAMRADPDTLPDAVVKLQAAIADATSSFGTVLAAELERAAVVARQRDALVELADAWRSDDAERKEAASTAATEAGVALVDILSTVASSAQGLSTQALMDEASSPPRSTMPKRAGAWVPAGRSMWVDESRDNALGFGSSGTVVFDGFFVNERRRLEPAAVKRLLVDMKPETSAKQEAMVKREFDNSRKLAQSSTRIVAPLDYHCGKDFIYIGFARCARSLRQLLEQRAADRQGPLPPAEALQYLRELALALRDCHAAGFAHNDIHCGNVLLTDAGELKVSDLQLSMRTVAGADNTQLTMMHGGLNLKNRAPEVARNATLPPARRTALTDAVDIFALGVVALQLLTGRLDLEVQLVTAGGGAPAAPQPAPAPAPPPPPPPPRSRVAPRRNLPPTEFALGRRVPPPPPRPAPKPPPEPRFGDVSVLERLSLPPHVAAEASVLLRACLAAAPDSRPSAAEASAHPLFWDAATAAARTKQLYELEQLRRGADAAEKEATLRGWLRAASLADAYDELAAWKDSAHPAMLRFYTRPRGSFKGTEYAGGLEQLLRFARNALEHLPERAALPQAYQPATPGQDALRAATQAYLRQNWPRLMLAVHACLRAANAL